MISYEFHVEPDRFQVVDSWFLWVCDRFFEVFAQKRFVPGRYDRGAARSCSIAAWSGCGLVVEDVIASYWHGSVA